MFDPSRIRSQDEIEADAFIGFQAADPLAVAERDEAVERLFASLEEMRRQTPLELAREETQEILAGLMGPILNGAELRLVTKSSQLLGTMPEPQCEAVYDFHINDMPLSGDENLYGLQLTAAALRILAAKLLGTNQPSASLVPPPEFLHVLANLIARVEAAGVPVARYEAFDLERWGMSVVGLMQAMRDDFDLICPIDQLANYNQFCAQFNGLYHATFGPPEPEPEAPPVMMLADSAVFRNAGWGVESIAADQGAQ